MIRSLRRRHRWVFIALAVLLPILFLAGIWVRQPIAVMDTLPPLAGEGVVPHEP